MRAEKAWPAAQSGPENPVETRCCSKAAYRSDRVAVNTLRAAAGVDLDSMTLAEAAEWYASRGIPVFPLQPRAKNPRKGGNGYKDSTSDLEQVRALWRENPDYNIGIPCGERSGFVVLDIDHRHGGDEILESWISKFGRWPPTAEVVTGSGGRHVYFRYDPGIRSCTLEDGVEIKSDGTYVVASPSIHPDTGRRYSFDGLDGAEALANLADPPGWLLRLAREKRQQRDPAPAAGVADEPIPEGRRNETLFKLAASLRARGLSRAGIEAALLAENQARCRPPLPETEVRRIAESAARYPAGQSINGGTGNRPGEANDADLFVRSPRRGGVDPSRVTSSAAAIEVLNSLTIWKSLRWSSWARRGDVFIGRTEGGLEVRIPSRKLGVFETAYAEILAATGVAILRPRRGVIRAVWGDIAELIHRAASSDVVEVSQPEAELKYDLIRCYEMAGCPAPIEEEQLFAILSALRGYIRRPQEPMAPPCVFPWENRWHVKLDVLKLWLSTPVAAAKFKRIDELEQAASLLGFAPHHEQLSAQYQLTRVKLRTWSAPLEVLSEE